MFDSNERKMIEQMGLNCLVIDDNNKSIKLVKLDYINKSDSFVKNNPYFQNAKLLDDETLKEFNINIKHLPMLIVDPSYWDDIYISIINKYQIISLVFSNILTAHLKTPKRGRIVLKNLNFLEQISTIKQFYLQPQKEMILTEFWDINDFSPLEKHSELEYLYIPTNDMFIDIDFSSIQKLKGFNLQFPKKNKTIFKCTDIEEVDTRYYYKDLTEAQNWKKLKKFGAYFDELKSFEGIKEFNYLEEFKGEFTSSLQSFEGLNSQSIKTFYYYTEARKTPVTLKGISGLKNVETIKLSGLKKLNSIADLPECKNLKEFWLEESNVPDDIEEITNIKSLKKVFIDYPEKVIKKFPKLKPYMS